jgi:hypothetical protein
MLNLACSDRADGFIPPGSVVNIIGDKSAGKSLLSLTMAAEVAHRPDLEHYHQEYDDVEAACKFPLDRMFGQKFLDKVEIPEEPSDTIEDFDRRFRSLLGETDPCIYYLDSYDAISSEDEQKEVKAADKARAEGKKVSGTYGQSKPKKSSQFFRVCKREVKKSGSVLVVISQVRENLERTGPWSPKFKRSGGKALDHNADVVIWLTIVKRHKKNERIYGYRLEARVDKNKVTGKRRDVRFDVFDQYGVDDIGSMVDFLVEEGWWSKVRETIQAHDIGLSAGRDRLIQYIEREGKEDKLKALAQRCWTKIERELKVNRKRKYE